MNDNMVLGMAKNIFEKPTPFVKISEKLWNFISEKNWLQIYNNCTTWCQTFQPHDET